MSDGPTPGGAIHRLNRMTRVALNEATTSAGAALAVARETEQPQESDLRWVIDSLNHALAHLRAAEGR